MESLENKFRSDDSLPLNTLKECQPHTRCYLEQICTDLCLFLQHSFCDVKTQKELKLEA